MLSIPLRSVLICSHYAPMPVMILSSTCWMLVILSHDKALSSTAEIEKKTNCTLLLRLWEAAHLSETIVYVDETTLPAISRLQIPVSPKNLVFFLPHHSLRRDRVPVRLKLLYDNLQREWKPARFSANETKAGIDQRKRAWRTKVIKWPMVVRS